MNRVIIKTNADTHHFTLSGTISFDSVANLCDMGSNLIKNGPQNIVFDFHEIVRSDSSALALLTAWARKARQLNKTIQFINLGPQLIDVAKLSNLDKVLYL